MTALFRRTLTVNAGSQIGAREGASWSTNDGFRIAFSCQYKSRRRPNKCKVRMWNLSQASIELLERRGIASVVAGYRGIRGSVDPRDLGRTSVIFSGDIFNVDTKRSGLDYITEFLVKDQGLLYREGIFDRSYGDTVTSTKILSDIIREGNLGTGFGVLTAPVVTYPFGITFKGTIREALNRVVDNLSFGDVVADWSIQDGNLQILTSDSQRTEENGFLLNSSSGLLKAQRKKKGVELTSLLIPEVKPGRFLQVQSREINGFFVARTVKHNGDGYEAGAKFETVIMARILEGV